MNGEVSARKGELRRIFQARRAALSVGQREALSHQICKHLLTLTAFREAKCVFCYYAMGSEVATQEICQAVLEEDKKLLLPVVQGENMLAVPWNGKDPLAPGTFGILEPAGRRDEEADLVLLPCLAFDTNGARLGYGKGYYDRWLTAHPTARRIALAYDLQRADALPIFTWDMPLNGILTESGLILPPVNDK